MPIYSSDGQRVVPLPFYFPEVSRRFSLKICTCLSTFWTHKGYEKHWRNVHGGVG